jgi:DNA adenine methylase
MEAKRVIFNDNLIYLIDMYKSFQINSLNKTLEHIEKRVDIFNLSKTNEEGYKEFRNFYNETKIPLDLFVLIAYSFNHQIRFNNSHKFNNPFGKNRSSFNDNMKKNLTHFILKLHSGNYQFLNKNFEDFDFSILSKDDFLYCDPPYLITTGTYNDGKRGFKGWNEKEEVKLLNILDNLDNKNIKFALSNVIEHKGKENILLKEWLEINNYKINYLNKDYSNASYQGKVRDKKSTIEVLITNYNPPKIIKYQSSLFDF